MYGTHRLSIDYVCSYLSVCIVFWTASWIPGVAGDSYPVVDFSYSTNASELPVYRPDIYIYIYLYYI